MNATETIRLANLLSDSDLAAHLARSIERHSRTTDPTWLRALETVIAAAQTELQRRRTTVDCCFETMREIFGAEAPAQPFCLIPPTYHGGCQMDDCLCAALDEEGLCEACWLLTK